MSSNNQAFLGCWMASQTSYFPSPKTCYQTCAESLWYISLAICVSPTLLLIFSLDRAEYLHSSFAGLAAGPAGRLSRLTLGGYLLRHIWTPVPANGVGPVSLDHCGYKSHVETRLESLLWQSLYHLQSVLLAEIPLTHVTRWDDTFWQGENTRYPSA